jgi:type IV pilus assembly protein PilM
MALPFLNGQSKKRDQTIAIDLGGRSTKAIHVQRKGDLFTLLRYAVLDAPIYDKHLSVDVLAEHLKVVVRTLDAKTRFASLTVGVNESVLRHAELPQIPVDDMRQILKNNSKNYLQQDLANHVFDCWLLPNVRLPGAEAPKAGAPQKQRVIVGGARKQLVEELQSAARQAGLVPDQIMPGILGPVNAFELAMPEIFSKEAVALVEIGFKSTSICLLNRGELVVNRVVAIGGDRLTAGLAEAMNISYAEAEGIKIGMPSEVQTAFEPLLSVLGRELRASIDFFEHQQDKSVSRVYISGGSARSEFILKALETELMATCVAWNPAATLQMGLPPQQAAELEQIAPQLSVAVGALATD